MITLDAGNVLLKPIQKKQLMSRLKRSIRLGDRLGNFVMNLKLRRTGKHVEMIARGKDRFGEFGARARGSSWIDAMHSIVREVLRELHNHVIRRAALAAV